MLLRAQLDGSEKARHFWAHCARLSAHLPAKQVVWICGGLQRSRERWRSSAESSAMVFETVNSFPQRLFEPLRCSSQVRLPALRNTLAVPSLSGLRNERNNAALHATEIAVASASAAETSSV